MVQCAITYSCSIHYIMLPHHESYGLGLVCWGEGWDLGFWVWGLGFGGLGGGAAAMTA